MPAWLAVVATAVGAFVGLASFVFTVTEGRSIHRREQRLREALSATEDPSQREVLGAAHQREVARVFARYLTPRRLYWWPPIGLAVIMIAWGIEGFALVDSEVQVLDGGQRDLNGTLSYYIGGVIVSLWIGTSSFVSWIHIRAEQARITHEYVHRRSPIAAAKSWRATVLDEQIAAYMAHQAKGAAPTAVDAPKPKPKRSWKERLQRFGQFMLPIVFTFGGAGVGWGAGAMIALPGDLVVRREVIEALGPTVGALQVFVPALAMVGLLLTVPTIYTESLEFELPDRYPHTPARPPRPFAWRSRAPMPNRVARLQRRRPR